MKRTNKTPRELRDRDGREMTFQQCEENEDGPK